VDRSDREAAAPGTDLTSAGAVADGWVVDALSASSDLVFVFDPDTVITWCNPACFRFLGYRPDEVIGHSIAEFLHPDDLERAAEVIGLSARGAFDEMPITSALYRARSADGTWVTVDLNGSTGADGSMLVIARVGGDLVLNDRLLEAVSGGAPFDQQVALVMEMGTWRHPLEGYVIFFRGEGGEPRSVSWNLPPELNGEAPMGGPTPWDVAMATNAEVVVDDVTAERSVDAIVSPRLAAAAREAGFLGCLAAPIEDPAHLGTSCIVIWTAAAGPTASGHRYALGNMRRALALVLQQRAQVSALERAARVDHLTGATSRSHFLELLDSIGDQADPDDRHVLLYLDLDGFKPVNDCHGHGAGDLVLTETAARLRDSVPPGAVVARLGGDEFGVLCAPGTSPGEAEALAQLLIEQIAAPLDIGTAQTQVTGSIGVAIGAAGQSPAHVLSVADTALLQAKADGRARWCTPDGSAR
jgi:diguanylate cyclase (GGDEF)-like protein/PAS domain S-box-containing protein